MNLSKALILGTLQGLTEFLPISSSGHLVIMQHYLGFKQPLVLFDLVLHVATLAVVIAFFRKDLKEIALSLIWFKKKTLKEKQSQRIFYLLLVGTIPTALLGLFFKNWIEILFTSLILTSLMLLFTGALLWLGERKVELNRGMEKMSLIDALLIGIMQGVAIIPGISRSGATISTGLLRGIKKDSAFRYSFLLSIPAILGALGLELRESFLKGDLPHHLLPWVGGALFSSIVGYLSLMLLRKLLLQRRLSLLAYYCWIMGTGLLIIQLLASFR